MSLRMDAPVVVKPDMVSKKASVMDGMYPEIMKGKLPKMEKKIQPKVTIAKPSLGRRSRSNLVLLNATKPISAVINELISKAIQSDSP